MAEIIECRYCAKFSEKEKDMSYLINLLTMAQTKDKSFDCSCYKWVIGAGILYKIIGEHDVLTLSADKTKITLLGIPVEMDFTKSDNIELWKNVTYDL